MINAVDLFCGAGGLTHGLARAGIKVRAGIDCDTACRHPFEFNNGATFIERDIRRLSAADMSSLFPKRGLKLLAGCAPCQPFSRYTQGRDPNQDPKWGLLQEFARIVGQVRPEFVTMENVATLTRHNIFSSFQKTLEKLGYFVDHAVLHCADYGLPQTRDRLVLVASRLGSIYLPPPNHIRMTVRDAISHLPAIQCGETHSSDRLHKSASLSPLNLKRISLSKPGGTWRDWPKKLRAKCHLKDSGKSYPSVYGRMTWDSPSPTMTTQCHGYGNGRFGHPEQNRAISLREAALLQSFPLDYEFVPKNAPAEFTSVGRLIGNAVPPLIGELVGKLLMEQHG